MRRGNDAGLEHLWAPTIESEGEGNGIVDMDQRLQLNGEQN